MNMWLFELKKVVSLILATTDRTEAIVVAAAAALSFLIVLRATSGAMGLKYPAWPRIFVAYGPAFVLALAALIAVRLYALPEIHSSALGLGLQIAAPVLIVLAIALPLAAWLEKGSYVECLMNLAVALLAMVIVAVMVRAGWKSFVGGREQMQRSKERTEMINTDVNAAQ